jgi:hypothetical protein
MGGRHIVPRPRRRLRLFLGVLIGMLVLPAIAYGAISRFADVPDTHQFAESINWAGQNDITDGCSVDPAGFCPDDFVTRGQMARFLENLAGSQAVDAGTLGGMAPDEFVGPRGPEGPQGEQGLQGPKGENGLTYVGTLIGFDGPNVTTDGDVTLEELFDYVSPNLSTGDFCFQDHPNFVDCLIEVDGIPNHSGCVFWETDASGGDFSVPQEVNIASDFVGVSFESWDTEDVRVDIFCPVP